MSYFERIQEAFINLEDFYIGKARREKGPAYDSFARNQKTILVIVDLQSAFLFRPENSAEEATEEFRKRLYNAGIDSQVMVRDSSNPELPKTNGKGARLHIMIPNDYKSIDKLESAHQESVKDYSQKEITKTLEKAKEEIAKAFRCCHKRESSAALIDVIHLSLNNVSTPSGGCLTNYIRKLEQ